MNPKQESIPLDVETHERYEDYEGIFGDNIWPTRDVEILERGGNLLIIKSYEYRRKVTPAHRRIFRLLVAFGETPDAPGSVTVACVWGLGPNVPRDVYIIDHTGERTACLSFEAWQGWLTGWWNQHKRMR